MEKAVTVWVYSRAQGKPILNAKSKIQSITVRALCDLYIEDYAKLHKKALLSKMFNLAEEWEYRQPNTNPTRHIRKFKEEPKARFLKSQELERLEEVMLDAEVIKLDKYICQIQRQGERPSF